jgi:hypothetical protein
MPNSNDNAQGRLTAGALRNSQPSRLQPVDRSNRAVATKRQVKGVRFAKTK